uniref:Uncharacterized protein n=1 Tax=Arcella intermedia TaxID=1963864 RepID=A0A6B2L247_9EUKA|eukprot:TRINITY_DN1520_c0_g1_i1.p1 TRINITY_DN1520_c0_g1~~TRINITY_DN1520_c0_g1_i1.p1  ORF type:complete len:502 (-),score=124.02 TRINITY_DN1520_c0_g1_i1:55-1560(-)
MKLLFTVTFLLLNFHLFNAHICLIWPQQRGGGWDPSGAMPGDDLCFEPTAPCGKKAIPSAPTDILYAGTTVYINFQQNLNHYNPGWPGYLDVSYAVGSSLPNDDPFVVLDRIPDYWSHAQSSQTNFSVPVLIPAVQCDWCTLRVRYHPNKPTEPIFHNCGDVKFVLPKALDRKLYGLVAPSKTSNNAVLSEILSTGGVVPTPISVSLLKRDMRIFPKDKPATEVIFQDLNVYLGNGLVAVDSKSQVVYFVGDLIQNFGIESPKTLYKYDIQQATFGVVTDLKTSGLQWNALINAGNNLVGIQQKQVGPYLFEYTVSNVSYSGEVVDIASTAQNDTFVNFFWADFDPLSGNTYILAGDENSLYQLNVVLYVVDKTGKSSVVWVDNTKYTLSNIFVDRTTGIIYSVSPGLFGMNNWSIVTIDPKTGGVSFVSKIAGGERFKSEYKGGVYNGLQNGKLTYSFTWYKTGASLLTLIDIQTGQVQFQTDINLGINSQQNLNMIFAL